MSSPHVASLASPPRARRPSFASSGSSHALDMTLDDEGGDTHGYASSQNTADETAHFNMREPNGLLYKDVDGEAAFTRSDAHSDKEKSLKRFAYTLIRGRAMPLKPLLFAVIWAIVAVVISWATSRNYGPHKKGDCRWWCSPLAIDGNALSYVGFALFLLTSFRVSEAYGRYMDAIRIWTNMGGTVTSFAKYAVQAFRPGMFHRGDRERILSFLVAFPVALKRELRGERDLRELKGVLTAGDLAKLQNADSMPSHCLYVLSCYLLRAQKQEAKLPQTFIVHMIRWIADLAGAADACMQIKTMPAPYSYITHLNTFLALWLFFLPFALVETTGWATILIVAFISYGILGVVANAAELEDPFGSDYNDLPLGRLAQKIQDSVAGSYHAALQNGNQFVCEVEDAELRASAKYWLNPELQN